MKDVFVLLWSWQSEKTNWIYFILFFFRSVEEIDRAGSRFVVSIVM